MTFSSQIILAEQCDGLINQVNLKSVEISDLNARLQEKVLVITALKDEFRKRKGKALVDNVVTKHTIDPEMLKNDVEPITPKLLNNRIAHSPYIKHTWEEATVLRDLVELVKANYPLYQPLESACRYTKQIQDLFTNISKTCPSINNSGDKLVVVTPKNKDKKIRFTEPVTSSGNTNTKIASSSNLVSNKPMLSSTGIKPSTSASGSQPSGNTKKDKIQQTPSSTQKNKVEAHPRKVKSSLKNKDCVVAPKGTANVQHSKLNANSKLKCVKCNGCMLSDNHDLCVLDFINNVNARRPTGRTFTIVGNACPLTRITTTTEVPLRKPTALESDTPKPVVTLVYSRKPRKSKTNVPVSKSKVVQIVLWYLDSGCSKHMTGDRSQLTNFVNKFLGTVKFGNDHVAKILGYGDYQIGNVTISRVYYVEGLGHNLFSVGQFCDSNLEVAFRQHTCFIHNLEGVDLLTRSRGNNQYTLSLGDIMVSSPISRHGLVRGLPKLKFEKDHLCPACAMGISKKKPHKPKSEDTNQEKLYLLHMDLCGPMRVASVTENKSATVQQQLNVSLTEWEEGFKVRCLFNISNGFNILRFTCLCFNGVDEDLMNLAKVYDLPYDAYYGMIVLMVLSIKSKGRIDLSEVNDRARAKAVKSIKMKEWKPTGKMFKNVGYKWVPTGRTFTIVGTKCPLTRFTSTKIVPPRKPVKSTVITNIKPSSASQWRPKETNHASSSSAPKIVESRTANHLEPNNHMGSNVSISTCSSSVQCRSYKSYLGNWIRAALHI
ncbi:hypothetical protein Tco_0755906 [Tanacetum coccineum]